MRVHRGAATAVPRSRPPSGRGQPIPLDRRGTTLLELSITLAIAGVLATIAVPNLTAMRVRAAEERDVMEVHSFLEEARSRAHIRLRAVTVELSGGALVATQEGAQVARQPLGDEIKAYAVDTGDGRITFNAEGGLDEDGPITVTLTSDEGRVQTLQIFPAIGSMRRSHS